MSITKHLNIIRIHQVSLHYLYLPSVCHSHSFKLLLEPINHSAPCFTFHQNIPYLALRVTLKKKKKEKSPKPIMLLPFLNLCRGFMLIIWSKIPCFPSYGLVSNLFVSTVSHYCFIIYSSCTCLATCLFTSLHVKLLESTNNVLLIFFLYPVSTFISAKVQEAKWITRFHQLSHHLKGHLCLF